MTSIRPNKRLGQNFLRDTRALERMLGTAELSPQDTVVEIGPGIGTLTVVLAHKAKKVVAIEKDEKMVEILRETLKEYSNVEVIRGDILKIEIRPFDKLRVVPSEVEGRSTKSETNPKPQNTKYKILNTKYKVVANLPYYITSPVIRKFLEAKHKPKLMVLMVQKEVAQRICSKPPNMSLLAVSVQFYAKPEIISYVSKNSFWPVPKVDSAIIKIVPLQHDVQKIHDREFFDIVRAGFKQPRKQLANNLVLGLKLSRQRVETWLNQVGINPTQRAQTLSLQDWVNLAQSIPKIKWKESGTMGE